MLHSNTSTSLFTTGLAVFAVLCGSSGFSRAADFDREPINYGTAEAINAFEKLKQDLDAKRVTVPHLPGTGHLKGVLATLKVPESSQVLVFSKTSFQRHRIAPATPRAIYFNDDLYIGFCVKGDVLEASASDPNLGTAFYTIDQAEKNWKITRQHGHCTLCHASSMNGSVPGHIVRSTVTDDTGNPRLTGGANKVDHSTPFERRWGGWYVTGTHGKQTHLGNFFGPVSTTIPPAGLNVTDLSERFNTKQYLTPHSDIVALMVLEHQSGLHNLISRASLNVRIAKYAEEEAAKKKKKPVETARMVIQTTGEDVLNYMLFCDETALKDPLKGTSNFTKEFNARGPFDKQGRSLRDFDLQTRLFKYPCSYLIYSEAFNGLPREVKEYILTRLHEVLTAKEPPARFAHLSQADRQAIREIVQQTVPNLPDCWK